MMDSKYYSLIEIIAFAVLALGFCIYQIWTVRRKPGEGRDKPKGEQQTGSDGQA